MVSTNQQPVVFLATFYKIANSFNHLREDIHKNRSKYQPMDFDIPLDLLPDIEPIYKDINKCLDKTLKIKLVVEKEDDKSSNYIFKFVDNNGNEIHLNELSAGEKGIIHFIFSIYGFDIKNGIIIIDEPEIHLHPQIQRKYLSIIEQAIEDLSLQVILVTHSSHFINLDTLPNVYRFYKENNSTKVVSPTIDIKKNVLADIMNYTNTSKIFFASKVVMVEGDTDEYFFRFFYDYYQRIKNSNLDLEFLYIRGKNKYIDWKKFHDEFKVESFFIGDLDNIVNTSFNILSIDELKKFEASYISTDDNNSPDSKVKLVDFIKSNIKSDEWTRILQKIKSNYSKKEFILTEGNLESYIGYIPNNEGKMDNVIKFCKSHFNQWTKSSDNKNKLYEFIEIFDYMAKDTQ